MTHEIKVTYRGNRPVLMIAECSCGNFKSDEGWTTQAQARQEGIKHLQDVIENLCSYADGVDAENESLKSDIISWQTANGTLQQMLNDVQNENIVLQGKVAEWQKCAEGDCDH